MVQRVHLFTAGKLAFKGISSKLETSCLGLADERRQTWLEAVKQESPRRSPIEARDALTLQLRLERMKLRNILKQKISERIAGIPKAVCRDSSNGFMSNRLCKIAVSKCRFKI